MRYLLSLFFLVPIFAFGQTITTIAGNGSIGFSGDDGAATAASFDEVWSLVFNNNDNLFVVDQHNYRIRKINPSGVITTIAGTTFGWSGDGGAATSAQLSSPWGLTVDDLNNIYVTDHNSIRKIDTNGIITTIAGIGIAGFSGDGGPATLAQISGPMGIAVDHKGTIFLCDESNSRIRKIDTSGIITTIAGDGTFGYNGDNIPATTAKLNIVNGVKVDHEGNLFVVDAGNCRIRKIDTNGIITTIVGNGVLGDSGDGGPATNASIRWPFNIAIDNYDNLYVPMDGKIRKIGVDGIITTVAGEGTMGFSGDGGLATNAQISNRMFITLDSCGHLYISDNGNSRIRKVTFPFCSNVSVPKIERYEDIALFPNPADNVISLIAAYDITQVSIINLIGRNEQSLNSNSNKVAINIENLPSGIYFAKINNKVVMKFAKR